MNLTSIMKLDYKLCKKLQDCGFHQKLDNGDWAYMKDTDELHLLRDDADTNWFIGNDYSSIVSENKWIKCPTLSELIEAVYSNDGTFSLQKFSDEKWSAIKSWSHSHGNDDYCEDSKMGEGNYPEAAVANLYLALHANSVNS